MQEICHFFSNYFRFFRFSCIFVPINPIDRHKTIVPSWLRRIIYCTLLYDSRCDVFGFGEIEFLTNLGLALVDGLETLTSEHIDLLGGEIRFE